MTSSYLGSRISLISVSDVRYEGTLFALNPGDKTFTLHNVRMFGTEGRKGGEGDIPPSNQAFEYIIFKTQDIKDLRVAAPPQQPPTAGAQAPPPTQPQTTQPPAPATAQVSKPQGQKSPETKEEKPEGKKEEAKAPEEFGGMGGPPGYGMYGYQGYPPSGYPQQYGFGYGGFPPGYNPYMYPMPYPQQGGDPKQPYGFYPPYMQQPPAGGPQGAAPSQAQPAGAAPTQPPAKAQEPTKPAPSKAPSSQPSSKLAPRQKPVAEKLQPAKPAPQAAPEQDPAAVHGHAEGEEKKYKGPSHRRGTGERTYPKRPAAPRGKTQFTTDFDFEASNAKLDKLKLAEEIESKVKTGELSQELESAPKYKKENFFDAISCEALDSKTSDGRRERDSQRKLNTETFGPGYRPRRYNPDNRNYNKDYTGGQRGSDGNYRNYRGGRGGRGRYGHSRGDSQQEPSLRREGQEAVSNQ